MRSVHSLHDSPPTEPHYPCPYNYGGGTFQGPGNYYPNVKSDLKILRLA